MKKTARIVAVSLLCGQLSGCRESNPAYIHPMHAYCRYTTPRSPCVLFASWFYKGPTATGACHNTLAIGQGYLLKVRIFAAPVSRIIVATQKLAGTRHN